ncbi:hypothetical protein DIPPA_22700 [Diplonema papillatum]|nr:hypothetical protein DIPPA_22700 [Diplonema papillatum]
MTRRKIVEFAASHRELLVAPLLPEGTPPAGWLLTMAEPLRWADDAAMEFATTLFNRALILFVIQGDGSRFVMPVGKSHRPNPIVLIHYANLHFDLVRGELSPAALAWYAGKTCYTGAKLTCSDGLRVDYPTKAST